MTPLEEAATKVVEALDVDDDTPVRVPSHVAIALARLLEVAKEPIAKVERIANDDYAKQLDGLTRELEDTKTALKNREDDLRHADGEASRYAGEAEKMKRVVEALRKQLCFPGWDRDWRPLRDALADLDAHVKGGDADDRPGTGPAVQASAPADSTSAEAFLRSLAASGRNRRAGYHIASAAERAAGKVHGPAQAALMALAVELRRGT